MKYKTVTKQTLKRITTFIVAVVFITPTIVGAQSIDRSVQDTLDRDSTWYSTEDVAAACTGAGNVKVDFNGGENAKIAFQYFIGRGLTPNQSAGIVGNLQAESGVNPDIQERNPRGNGRGGYGIAQWTGGRRVAIENYARDTGQDLKSLQFQLDYLWDQELMKGYKTTVLDPIKASSTIRQSSDIFLHDFEKPFDQSERVEVYRASLGQKVYDLFAAESGNIVPVVANTAACQDGGGPITGFVGFPLDTTKRRMDQLNGGCFRNGVMCQGGHPYAAHDIIADPATPVVSILDGTVISIGTDKCPGRLISIYSQKENVTVSYLHLSMSKTLVKDGDAVTAGQRIGFVGSGPEGCGTPHLHIDAAEGNRRPGCRRENCPSANQAIFKAGSERISLPKSLFETYNKLQEGMQA